MKNKTLVTLIADFVSETAPIGQVGLNQALFNIGRLVGNIKWVNGIYLPIKKKKIYLPTSHLPIIYFLT